MSFYIIKSSGERERFNINKFRKSLRKAGASSSIIDKILTEIKKLRPKTTNELHRYAIKRLDELDRPIATRYNIKRALMDLGPIGYPFEWFIAEVYKHQGYTVTGSQIFQGFCVSHEIDVVAIKNNKHIMIECKFHNRTGLTSDVKVTLYIQARFEDVRKALEQEEKDNSQLHEAWIVTNTRFTSEAEKYAACVGIKLISFSSPKGGGLAYMIDKLGLYPVTAITSLNKRQKKMLIQDGIVLCRDIKKHVSSLQRLHLTDYQIKKLVQESEQACNLGVVEAQ